MTFKTPSNRWIANPTGAIGIIILHQLPKLIPKRRMVCEISVELVQVFLTTISL